MQRSASVRDRYPAFNPRLTREALKRQFQDAGQTASFGASLYLSGVLSYLTAEILTAASESAANRPEGTGRRKTILPSDLGAAVSCDDELSRVFAASNESSLPSPAADEDDGRSGRNRNSFIGHVLKTIGSFASLFEDSLN